MNIKPNAGLKGKTVFRERQRTPRSLLDAVNLQKPIHLIPLSPLGIQYSNSLSSAKTIDTNVRTPRSMVDPALLNGHRP